MWTYALNFTHQSIYDLKKSVMFLKKKAVVYFANISLLANVSMLLIAILQTVLEANCTLSPLLALLSFKLKISGVSLPANQSSHGVCLSVSPFNYNSFKNANFAIIIMAFYRNRTKRDKARVSRTVEGSISKPIWGCRKVSVKTIKRTYKNFS